MKKKDLFELLHGLKAVEHFCGVRFAIAVDENYRNILPKCQSIEKGILPSPEYTEYDKKRLVVITQFCNKNEDGSLKTSGDSYDIPASVMAEFNTALAPINEECKEVIEARKEQAAIYAEVLEEEIDIELSMITNADLPKEISAAQLRGIRFMRPE